MIPGACVRQERREDMVDILFAQRLDCPFGGARQFLVKVPASDGTFIDTIGIVRGDLVLGNMYVVPGQPQNLTHTERAGE